jgi:hypothetical protein
MPGKKRECHLQADLLVTSFKTTLAVQSFLVESQLLSPQPHVSVLLVMQLAIKSKRE